MPNTSGLQDRVYSGARLLDTEAPGWVQCIDLLHLDLRSFQSCILGQLFGDYGAGWDALGLTSQDCQDLGFDVSIRGDGSCRVRLSRKSLADPDHVA